MAFSPRLSSAGMQSSKYYAYNYGTHAFTYPLPNCTTYAMARSHEIAITCYGGSWDLITDDDDPYWWQAGPHFGNAETWWYGAASAGPAHGWRRSKNPRLGAIAVWKHYRTDYNEGGHVAVVEEIREDGYVKMSQSHYGGAYFDTTGWVKPVQNQAGGGYPGVFYGYLINPLSAGDEPGPEIKPQPIIYRRGDWVKIVSFGNANSYGTGRKAYGIGWKRKILNICAGRPYPYQVGLGRSTTGFYKAKALSKI